MDSENQTEPPLSETPPDSEAKFRRKGIYLLPNLFTTGALFAGFYAIVSAINGSYETAAISIFVAMALDGVDGRIARITNTQSDFGAEYDSLADMVSFGLAPALVAYEWLLTDLGKIGWLGAFVFTATAALRLARFNTQARVIDKRYFQGLPSPAAAAVIAGIIWFVESYSLKAVLPTGSVLFSATIAMALLMVSNIRYYSFKEFDLRGRVPFVAVLAIVLAFAFISIDPAAVLAFGFLGYATSGPLMTLVQIRRRRIQRKRAARSGHDVG
ncbi:MAG TPA: CDP-diacylglycerol--serine O-phosphatidyltransferase [Gammaproteobacteria bacterium]|nr:CDP-diacylglycerol--serine O-phosphatidyltransferase [Gammaproteobacteria bacterium]|tara:strand:+ start:1176 stop:1988 length:813 start_codon:yes stop_codon:yes gene_type:complete